jgi:hypothetical protein
VQEIDIEIPSFGCVIEGVDPDSGAAIIPPSELVGLAGSLHQVVSTTGGTQIMDALREEVIFQRMWRLYTLFRVERLGFMSGILGKENRWKSSTFEAACHSHGYAIPPPKKKHSSPPEVSFHALI